MSSVASSSWIISRRDDLLFFSGSALLGYAFVLFAFALGELPTRFLVAFAFAIDGPHVYSTATRALFDRNERKNLRWLWCLVLPLCLLIGPVLMLSLGRAWLLVVIASLSHYHISKQHMGFVMIYKRKDGERCDYKLDKYFTLVSLILPFMFYLSAIAVGTSALLPLFLIPAVVLSLWYVWHQAQRGWANKPKLLLLAAFIPLQWAAWSFAALEPNSISRLVSAAVATNVGHSFQYLRLMYFHNHNRYAQSGGLLETISRKWIYFLAAAIALASPLNLLLPYLAPPVIRSAAVGFLFFHFVVDSKIWRVRGNPDLAEALHL
ncbi:MAG TPA: hypothetical protein VJS64_19895 [Pyrinomonadaceae bacterium]|nr:hypothetical protein [Pyrinomonadaceae bacterium]